MGKVVAVEEGATPLMYACQQARESDVLDILNNKPKTVYERDRTHKSALHYCAEAQTTSCAELILKTAPDLLEDKDEDGFTPLHLAVIAGNLGLLQLLITKGANVNAFDNEKHSPIHWATVCGEREALETLIKAGATVCTADIHGGYPLHYAAQMCGVGLENGINSRAGLSILRSLLAHGANVDERDKDGRQPILWAASADAQSRDPRARFTSSGSSEAILALVKAGASVEAADKDGLTALHCAASRGHTDCLETLVAFCGANVDVIDHNGCTALFYAVTLGHADATQLLLNLGAEPNRQDRKGRTPAHCGASKGQLETLRLLLSSGANLWLRNVKGDVPLHDAVASGRKELVRWLLNQRSEAANIANNDGKCPILVASLNNNVDMIKILLDAGSLVNPVMRSSKGVMMTPLDAALIRGHRSGAKFIQLHGGVPFTKLNDSSSALKGNLPREMISHVTSERVIEPKDAFTVLPESTNSRFLYDPQIVAEDLAIQHIERIDNPSDLGKRIDDSYDDDYKSRRRRRRKKSERKRSQSHESKDDESDNNEVVRERHRRKSIRRTDSDEENLKHFHPDDLIKNELKNLQRLTQDNTVSKRSSREDEEKHKRMRRRSNVDLDANDQDELLDNYGSSSSHSEDSQKRAIKLKKKKRSVSVDNCVSDKDIAKEELPLPISATNEKEPPAIQKLEEPENSVQQTTYEEKDVNKEKNENFFSSSTDEHDNVLSQKTEAIVHKSHVEDVENGNLEALSTNDLDSVLKEKEVIEDKTNELKDQLDNLENFEVNEEKFSITEKEELTSQFEKIPLQTPHEVIKRRQSQPGLSRMDTLDIQRKAHSQPASRRSSRERDDSGDWLNMREDDDLSIIDLTSQKINEWDTGQNRSKNDTFYPLDDVETMVGTLRLGEGDGRSASVGEESIASTRNEDSSIMMDSGIEPSPRRTTTTGKHANNSRQRLNQKTGKSTLGANTGKRNVRQCKKGKPGDFSSVVDYSVTQAVQKTIRKYHLERKIFYQLLELKRLQIRAGRANEQVLVKRLSDEYHKSSQMAGLKFYTGPYTFHQFETFLYAQLHGLQTGSHLSLLKPSNDVESLSEILKRSEANPLTEDINNVCETCGGNPISCVSSTHRCFHATHAYTGIPCAAYISKMNHHTMPKDNFLPKINLSDSKIGMKKINSKSPVTLEVIHGKEKQIIELPTEKLDSNKRYYVSFTIKGGGPETPVTEPHHGRQHAKSF